MLIKDFIFVFNESVKHPKCKIPKTRTFCKTVVYRVSEKVCEEKLTTFFFLRLNKENRNIHLTYFNAFTNEMSCVAFIFFFLAVWKMLAESNHESQKKKWRLQKLSVHISKKKNSIKKAFKFNRSAGKKKLKIFRKFEVFLMTLPANSFANGKLIIFFF